MTQNFGIPSPQALPPAGHDDIAFRPACDQVTPILQANGLVAHTLALPDGSTRILVEMPPMTIPDAYREMDSMGLCKVGGDRVPILFADQVPQQAIAQPVVGGAMPMATPAPDSAPGTPWGMVLGGMAVIALVGGFLALGFKAGLFSGKTSEQTSEQFTEKTSEPVNPRPNQSSGQFSGGEQATGQTSEQFAEQDAEQFTEQSSDLIDQVWG